MTGDLQALATLHMSSPRKLNASTHVQKYLQKKRSSFSGNTYILYIYNFSCLSRCLMSAVMTLSFIFEWKQSGLGFASKYLQIFCFQMLLYACLSF